LNNNILYNDSLYKNFINNNKIENLNKLYNINDVNKHNIFYFACIDDLLDIVMHLLVINNINIDGDNEFHLASMNNKINIVKFLFNKYPDLLNFINLLNNNNNNCILYTLNNNNLDIIKYIFLIKNNDIINIIWNNNIYLLKKISLTYYEECIICYEKSNVITNCNHYYCNVCITKLLLDKDLCVLCNRKFNIINIIL